MHICLSSRKVRPARSILHIFALTALVRYAQCHCMDSASILALRKERLQWTQEEMAEYLGVDRATVSRIETGQAPSGPVLKLLKMLADQSAGAGAESAA